jgi:triosephosphate isomerase
MSQRTPLIAGNWKMQKGPAEARAFASALRDALPSLSGREAAVFPPFTALPAVADVLRDSAIGYGAQNMHWEKQGAFTGEIAPGFLTELGCRYVLIGHSERRSLFGETDATCRSKVTAALAAGITPVLCCGETLAQRDADTTFAVVDTQLAGALSGLEPDRQIVVAYEPVWAIGTDRTATPEQAGEVHAHIRTWLSANVSPAAAHATRILYGGSVKPDNIDALMKVPDIDGALVGGASLDLPSFTRLVSFH